MRLSIFAILFLLLNACSTDAEFDIEKIDVDDPDVCVDVESCDQDDESETGENGNGNDDGDDDDDGDDGDDDGDATPAQSSTECTTTELGKYVSDNVILGDRFKKDCSPEFTKIYVKKNNGDKQTLEFTRFQDVMIGSSTINCVKLFKRWNIDGVLLEKLEYDQTCNLKN